MWCRNLHFTRIRPWDIFYFELGVALHITIHRGGLWNGNQILSSKWIEDSTKEKSRWGELSYGYLWWIVDDCNATLGDGGNVIFINPEKKIVVTIASRFMPRAKDRIELIRKHFMPLFE